MRWSSWLLFLCVSQQCASFVVLPFVQIDFTHYFRLAQCNAKCAAKHGNLIRKKLHDGSHIKFTINDSDNAKNCELGCNKGRPFIRLKVRSPRQSLEDGIQFWQETVGQQTKSERFGPSPIKAVRVGCMNIVSNNENDYEDGVEALVFIDLSRRYDGPIRYVVQWKQKIVLLDKVEESNWITASVEAQPYFKVEGMMPRTQYSFKVTAVNPKGRLGNAVVSEWIEATSLGSYHDLPADSLHVVPKYDSDNGVSALVLWDHLFVDDLKSTPGSPQKLGSCHLQITMSNATHQHATNFIMDNGEGFLLSHLEFASDYALTVSALPLLPDGEDDSVATASVMGRFLTMACNEVFGAGSIKCPPEPVQRLRIHLLANGTADIKWIPPADPSSILVYQLFYTTDTVGCSEKPVNTYLNASAKSTRVQFSCQRPCEYLVRLINYDIYGRDAVSELRVLYRPRVTAPTSNILLVVIPVSVLLFFIILLKLFSYFSCQLQAGKIPVKAKANVLPV